MSTPTWNEEFELPDWSYPVSDRYSQLFWIYLKKYDMVAGNASIKIYVNKAVKELCLKWKRDIILNFNTWKKWNYLMLFISIERLNICKKL